MEGVAARIRPAEERSRTHPAEGVSRMAAAAAVRSRLHHNPAVDGAGAAEGEGAADGEGAAEGEGAGCIGWVAGTSVFQILRDPGLGEDGREGDRPDNLPTFVQPFFFDGGIHISIAAESFFFCGWAGATCSGSTWLQSRR